MRTIAGYRALALACSLLLMAGCVQYVPKGGEISELTPELKIPNVRFEGLWGDNDRTAFIGRGLGVTRSQWEELRAKLSAAGWLTLEFQSAPGRKTLRVQLLKVMPESARSSIQEMKLIWAKDALYVGSISRGAPMRAQSLAETEYGQWLNRVLWPKLEEAANGKDIVPKTML